MNKHTDPSDPLRIKAENQLARMGRSAQDAVLRPAELLHELQVHQIELDMQNENLRKAQVALEESRDRYLDLYEFAPMGYLTLTREGVIIASNLTAASLLGIVRNKLLQRRFDQLVAPQDRDRWRYLFINVMMHGGKKEIELVLQDGDDQPMHAHIDCLRIQPGPPPSTLRVAFTAIPEREIITRQLLEMHKLLDEVQRISKVGGWKYDCATAHVTWTDEVYRIYGVGKDHDPDSLNNSVDFYLPEDRPRVSAAFDRAVNEGEPYDLELYFVRLNGERIWVRIIGKPATENGKIIAVTGMIMDITARKQADESLRAQEKFFRMIAENVDDFIAVVDQDGRLLYSNPSYSRLVGEVDALKGSDYFSAIYPDDLERVKQAFGDTLQTGTSHRINFRFLQANGSIAYMESCGVLIRNSQGQATSVVMVFRDVTERNKADEIIRNLAFHDSLTKIPNRRMLLNRLEQTLASSKLSGRYACLMFIDLDNFKPINDTHGHAAGDLLLVEVANRIAACLREVDTVARLGGDEFVVLLSDLSEDKTESARQASLVAEEIRSILAAPYSLTLRLEDGSNAWITYKCSSSIGVVLFTGQHASQSDVLKWADAAMYQAKKNGCNKICYSK